MNDETRMVELETRLAFQEQTLQELNEALCRQQQRIHDLERLCRHLLAQLRTLDAGAEGSVKLEQPPPHY